MPALPFIAAAAMVAGTVMSAQAQSKAASAQKQATAAQQKMSDYQAARERIQAVRQARIQNAGMIAGAGAAGIGFESSGVVGAESSAASQLGANIGASNVVSGFANMASQANQKAADYMSRANNWQAIGQIGGAMLGAQGGWASVFGGNTFGSAMGKAAPPMVRK